MTFEKRLEMYKNKRAFIKDIALAFNKNTSTHTVRDITYEVWNKTVETNTYYEEWIIVHFAGGACSPCRVSGNSNTANFRVIGNLIDGGYYKEEFIYADMIKSGYTKLKM